ncbi:hypothetical protein HYU17_02375 [Candidatus Woesearchaeota archaeon]|nr:hypothetical protein [Candidatus Woesearchaeota archaeon]
MGLESASGNAKAGFTVSSKAVAVAAITVLFIVSLFLWTLPFQKNRLPFGEGDSAWHFAIGDSIAHNDKAAFRLPYYIGVWYYGFNKILGPFAPEYPPPSHANYALMQVLGGERFLPVFIYRAVASFLGVLAVFFVISRLFGVLPGFLAGLGLSFSLREQLTYLFGQQPTLTAVLITPVASYAWYKYLVSFYGAGSGDEGSTGGSGNKVYLFLSFTLLASQFLLHLQGFVASAVFIAVLTALMAVRFRKLPVSKSSLLHLGVAVALFAVVAAPFIAIYAGSADINVPRLGFKRLFEWGISPSLVQGSFPPSFVEFSAEYPNVLLPFLAAGLVLLLLRLLLVKNNLKELFMLSWLISAFIVLHLDVFIGIGLNRLARMLVLENYIFYSLIALTAVWLPQALSSFLKIGSRISSAAKYGLAAMLVLLLVSTSGESSYSSLKGAYGSIDRITPVQAEFAESLNSLVPEGAYVYDPSVKIVGQWRYPKMRWMLAISQRHVGRYDGGEIAGEGSFDKSQIYFLFDYSDIALFASSLQYQQQAAAWASQLQQLEQRMFNNTAPLYNGNNIRLYKYEGFGGVAA